MSLRNRGEGISSGSGDSLVGVEVSLVFPHGPAAAGELVGKRDGGFVVPDASFEPHGPALELVERLVSFVERFGAIENGTSAVDEEGSQIFVTLFGDTSEVSSFSGTVFPGGDAKPGGEVTT